MTAPLTPALLEIGPDGWMLVVGAAGMVAPVTLPYGVTVSRSTVESIIIRLNPTLAIACAGTLT